MTKRELVLKVAAETGLIQQDVMSVLQKALDGIVAALAAGDTVEFRNFGVFETRTRKPRIGRNPRQPGREYKIPKRRVVKFKPGRVMRAQVSVVRPAPK